MVMSIGMQAGIKANAETNLPSAFNVFPTRKMMNGPVTAKMPSSIGLTKGFNSVTRGWINPPI